MALPRGNRMVLTLLVAAAALAAVVALTLQRSPSAPVITARQPDLSMKWKIGPTLRELLANFAVLRRPATSAEHAAARTFRYMIGVGRERLVTPGGSAAGQP